MDVGLLISRLVLALALGAHGAQKLFAVIAGVGEITAGARSLWHTITRVFS